MTLTLSVLRCPDAAAPETRTLEGGEFRIGRGRDNDWVLTDPERILSKHHCVIAWRGGAWQIADTSTNGTFINQEAEPLGGGRVRALEDGDRIRLGSYEIEARLQPAAGRIGRQGYDPAGYGGAAARGGFDDPFGDDPFATPAAPAAPVAPDDWPGGGNSISLPGDFDPLAAPDDSLFGAGPVADHSPAHNDAFRPAPMAPKLLPDDWDLGIEPGEAGPPVSHPAPAAPVAPAIAPLGVPSAAPVSSDGGLVEVFLAAAGMQGFAVPDDPAAMMRRLGGVFRALVGGLRQVMIARTGIKGEFRIEQTMVRARGNNPLKFSADDDDAMAALLGLGRRTGDMEAEQAVSDALRDIRLHELAMMSAMQAAVRAMLERLDPAALRSEAEAARALLPAQRKARAFEAFETLHGQMTRALVDDFDNVFGHAFARAYERALADAEGRER